jgi:hypothetical protein
MTFVEHWPCSRLTLATASTSKDRLSSVVRDAYDPLGAVTPDETGLPGHASEGLVGSQEVHEGQDQIDGA